MKSESSATRIWIFGSGTFALEAYRAAVSGGVNVVGIIDHNHSRFDLFKNESVQTLDITEVQTLNLLPVYLAICNPYANAQDLVKKISPTKGYSSTHSPVELCKLLAEINQKVQRYWLTSEFQIYNENISKINMFRDLLGDPESKDLYSQILAYRTFGDLDSAPVGEGVNIQYMPKNLATPPKIMNIVELGSFGGENLKSFKENGFDFRSGYAFEPDLNNYQLLIRTLGNLEIYNLHTLPLAAWDSEEKLHFDSNGGSDSSVSNFGDDFVQGVSLDHLIPQSTDINYIKMDIEGAELNALQGSYRIIEMFTPHLAVCVYHAPSDLWEIGLWIHENFGGRYTFHLRTYAEQTFETVLYCIPN